jgi:hypothetical protein
LIGAEAALKEPPGRFAIEVAIEKSIEIETPGRPIGGGGFDPPHRRYTERTHR